MITTNAKVKIAELISVELVSGELGTSGQAEAATDTSLISEVTSTISAVTVVQSGQQFITTYNINSLTGNGNTYQEYGNFFTTSDTLFNRITFTGVPKNSALEFQVKSIVNVN